MQFYAKNLTAEQLAEASAYMTWLTPDDGGSGLSAGAIAGITVGCAVAAAAAAAAVFLLVKRRHRPSVTDAEAAIRVLKVRPAGPWHLLHGAVAPAPATWRACCSRAYPQPPGAHTSLARPRSQPLHPLPVATLQDADHPCALDAKGLASLAGGSGTKGSGSGTGKASPSSSAFDSLSDLSRHTSTEVLAMDLGKEWRVDVSQVGELSARAVRTQRAELGRAGACSGCTGGAAAGVWRRPGPQYNVTTPSGTAQVRNGQGGQPNQAGRRLPGRRVQGAPAHAALPLPRCPACDALLPLLAWACLPAPRCPACPPSCAALLPCCPTRLHRTHGCRVPHACLQAMLNGCEPVAVKVGCLGLGMAMCCAPPAAGLRGPRSPPPPPRPQVVPLTGGSAHGSAGSASADGSAAGSTAAFLHEARMLHGLRHRCIVQLAGVALAGDKALLIMELMPAGDLFKALNMRDRSGERVFGWARKGKRVALDVASALAFLHHRRVMHFDVKVRWGGGRGCAGQLQERLRAEGCGGRLRGGRRDCPPMQPSDALQCLRGSRWPRHAHGSSQLTRCAPAPPATPLCRPAT